MPHYPTAITIRVETDAHVSKEDLFAWAKMVMQVEECSQVGVDACREIETSKIKVEERK